MTDWNDGDRCLPLDAVYDRVIDGVDVYVAGTADLITGGRRLSVQPTVAGRWVGSINADLRCYADIRLELRLPNSQTSEFVVGPRYRGVTLIRGRGPAPNPSPQRRK